jgi:hypothetical protein
MPRVICTSINRSYRAVDLRPTDCATSANIDGSLMYLTDYFNQGNTCSLLRMQTTL